MRKISVDGSKDLQRTILAYEQNSNKAHPAQHSIIDYGMSKGGPISSSRETCVSHIKREGEEQALVSCGYPLHSTLFYKTNWNEDTYV